MFEIYTQFFDYLSDRKLLTHERLTGDATGFIDLLREHPDPESPRIITEYRKYIESLIEHGLKTKPVDRYICEYFRDRGILKQTERGIPIITIKSEPKPKRRLNSSEIVEIRRSRSAALAIADIIEQSMRSFGEMGVEAKTEETLSSLSDDGDGGPPGGTRGAGREITMTGHEPDGQPVQVFEPAHEYRLRFRVGAPSKDNLAQGDTAIGDVPEGGLQTHWVVTSSDVEFLPGPSAAVRQGDGGWIAEFDLLIPETGESDTAELALRKAEAPGKIFVMLYAVKNGGKDLYRQLTADLSAAPRVETDAIVAAAGHTNLATRHEWTTPNNHIQIIVGGSKAFVTTFRAARNEYHFPHEWPATGDRLAGAIQNVRDALERFREKLDGYLNDLDPAELAARLATPSWKPYSNERGWYLPDCADPAHRSAFATVQASTEWRDLASAGYTLFDSCFPQGSQIRDVIEKLDPGSRIDFDWTDRSGAGWTHVPWALMYMEPVDVLGNVHADPERFLGLRFRLGYRAWTVAEASRALGDPASAHSVLLLYWGDKQGDEVAAESRWQMSKYTALPLPRLLPDVAQPDPKKQIMMALDAPMPPPTAVLYFYCHCSVGDGSKPFLRFGNTSQSQDTVGQNELSQNRLVDAPLVFANACTTVQADPHMTNMLEDSFFRRGARAFIGTETKVPVQLASKFAWLFFQFFCRRADPDPMAAGEALVQARMFLWTQYRNIGGLFYCLVNQYDLFLASDQEVRALRS
jgi:CHAT domain-containing protein